MICKRMANSQKSLYLLRNLVIKQKIAQVATISANNDFEIGNRIAEAMNLWDKRDHENKISIQSDIDAVKYAKTLGLLPIPEAVSTCIYKQIMDNGELE